MELKHSLDFVTSSGNLGHKMVKSGAAALEEWCRMSVCGYPGVNITNMSSAWRDGRAFCALIHRYRPEVLDWDRVERRDWAG